MQIPIFDPKTNEISGAKKGTFAYAHEEAHLKFSESNFGKNIQFLEQMSEFYAIISLTISFFFNPFKYVALVLVILMIFAFIFEEVYCNYKAVENNRNIYK